MSGTGKVKLRLRIQPPAKRDGYYGVDVYTEMWEGDELLDIKYIEHKIPLTVSDEEIAERYNELQVRLVEKIAEFKDRE